MAMQTATNVVRALSGDKAPNVVPQLDA